MGDASPVSTKPLGDGAVRVELGRALSLEVHRRVRGYCLALESAMLPGVVEWVPSYTAVTVFYDASQVSYAAFAARLAALAVDAAYPTPARSVTLPVSYSGEHGPDLAFVAAHHGLCEPEVVALHAGAHYLVYMLGFAPGFAYLGGLPSGLATPRLDTPRRTVPAGSVGIAGSQTGVYPLATPGGWRIIGRTPVRMFDPARPVPVVLQLGDTVRFRAVSEQEYAGIAAQVVAGAYAIEVSA